MRPIFVDVMPSWLGAESVLPFGSTVHLLALLAVLLLALGLAWRRGLDVRAAYGAGISGIAGALIAGRLWAFAPGFGDSMGSGFHLLQGEKGVIGVFIGAGLGAAAFLLTIRKPLLAYADALIPAVFLGYTVARIGCLLGGCCFGTPTDVPWAIHYTVGSAAFMAHLAAGLIPANAAESLAVHPTPLYHAAAGLLLFWATRRAFGRPGRPMAVALTGYGMARFFIEFYRGDAVPFWHGLDANQFACLVFMALGISLWLYCRAKWKSSIPLKDGVRC